MTPEQIAEKCVLEYNDPHGPKLQDIIAKAIQSAIDETWEEAARVAEETVVGADPYCCELIGRDIAASLRARKGQS